ncbi:HAMP domain-containing protein [Amycolatopsis palatopharyngis]|uniref:HAMP domain-containing protein n=1 Tax=Amycolatopsis palatopharyngis TaxID=187982 RepID=UPI000E241232|nr:HAMP domain-containing protein [Amycolatopsis palatopharyngis]
MDQGTADRARKQSRATGQQLTEAAFPSRLSGGSTATFVLLLLIASFCATYLINGPRELFGNAESALVDPHIAAEQLRATESLAASVAISATDAARDLRVATESGVLATENTERLLATLSETYPHWRGLAVLDSATGALLAARGETIPAEGLRDLQVDNVTVQPVVRSGGSTIVLTTTPLAGSNAGKLLVSSVGLRDPAPQLDDGVNQQIRLITAAGTTVVPVGANRATGQDTGPTAPVDLLERATVAAAAGQSGVLTGERITSNDATDNARVPVVSYAPVVHDNAAGMLGLSVVSVADIPIRAGPTTWPGLVPAVSLIVLATICLLLLRRGLESPILRLRTDAITIAAGNLRHPIRQSRSAEVRRITAAMERCRLRLRGSDRRPAKRVPRRAIRANAVLVVLLCALLSWSATVAATIGTRQADPSVSIISEHDLRVSRAAETVRRGMSEGLSDLRAAARLGTDPDRLQSMITELSRPGSRFRSVYLADSSGAVLQHAGRDPLRAPENIPAGDGLRQHNTSGRVPIVVAHAELTEAGQFLVGEYDVTRIAALMRIESGRTRLVDDGGRTIADTEGFLAFEQLPDGPLRNSAESAISGEPARTATETALIAALPVATDGSVADLGWALIAEQPLGSLLAAENRVSDGALVASLLTAVVALMMFGWHHLMLVRPLRRVAESVEALAAGDTRTVIYPQRHDAIGTIACCVEVCRQAMQEGLGKLGSSRRPTGAATDPTRLLRSLSEVDGGSDVQLGDPARGAAERAATRRPEYRRGGAARKPPVRRGPVRAGQRNER